MKISLRYLLLFLLALGLTAPARATAPPATGRPLGEILNADGTLKVGANGSFDARQFRMRTAPDGRPVFRPASTKGAGDERWADGFGLPTGADNDVRVVVRAGANIYIGGSFAVVGEAAASGIARWDGQAWHALGAGISGQYSVVQALAVAPNGDLYAGGTFAQAGGTAASNVARWNGTTWSAVGQVGANNGVNGTVAALAVAGNGDLYVGGTFSGAAGGTVAGNVARWNGTAWSALGASGAEGTDGSVQALAVANNGRLYVAGSFGSVGGRITALNVALWDGAVWSALGPGNNGSAGGNVLALAVAPNGDVYVGGSFMLGNAATGSLVARWDGTTWSNISPVAGSGGLVRCLAMAPNGDVYAGGLFSAAGGITARNVARWNGSTWSSLGVGANDAVYGLTLDGSGNLYAGGRFLQAGTADTKRVAKWSGTAWMGLESTAALGPDFAVGALAVAANGDVYVGGTFTRVGSLPANRIAKWNGTTWSTLGTGPTNGVNGNVATLLLAANGDLYVGGSFDTAGGVAVTCVAKWSGTTWSAVGPASPNGVIWQVNALAQTANGDVYIGGNIVFQVGNTSIINIARWNGTTLNPLGSGSTNGVNGMVFALAAAPSGDLYVGGSFLQAGGAPASFVAKWSGTAWSALGTGTGSPVKALAMAPNGDLYVGGNFTQAGGQSTGPVARWNGTAWSSLGGGLTGSGFSLQRYVAALTIDGNGDLYVGGVFTQPGSTFMSNIARWDGTSWNSLGTGTNKDVVVLAVGANRKLYVGGFFTTTGDGSKAMAHFAIYDPNAPLAARAAQAAPAALFPNPAHGAATLRLPAGAPRLPLTLVDAQGRTVRRYPAPTTAEAALDLRGLPAGTYLVRCGEFSQRLVVE